MDESTSSWRLDGDGEWTRSSVDAEGRPLIDIQNLLMHQIGQRTRSGKRR
jgi:polyphosphate kinase